MHIIILYSVYRGRRQAFFTQEVASGLCSHVAKVESNDNGIKKTPLCAKNNTWTCTQHHLY